MSTQIIGKISKGVQPRRRRSASIHVLGGMNWRDHLAIQKERIRLGEYQRIGKVDALCFEVTELSNPNMLILGQQRTPDGRMAWPGKNLDWLGRGPEIAFTSDMMEVLLTSRPFPLPPDVPDPTWKWEKLGDTPPLIKQLISDRAMTIKGTRMLMIQPVSQIQWVLDQVIPGRARREVHQVVADPMGNHMAFIYDVDDQAAYLVGGKIR